MFKYSQLTECDHYTSQNTSQHQHNFYTWHSDKNMHFTDKNWLNSQYKNQESKRGDYTCGICSKMCFTSKPVMRSVRSRGGIVVYWPRGSNWVKAGETLSWNYPDIGHCQKHANNVTLNLLKKITLKQICQNRWSFINISTESKKNEYHQKLPIGICKKWIFFGKTFM